MDPLHPSLPSVPKTARSAIRRPSSKQASFEHIPPGQSRTSSKQASFEGSRGSKSPTGSDTLVSWGSNQSFPTGTTNDTNKVLAAVAKLERDIMRLKQDWHVEAAQFRDVKLEFYLHVTKDTDRWAEQQVMNKNLMDIVCALESEAGVPGRMRSGSKKCRSKLEGSRGKVGHDISDIPTAGDVVVLRGEHCVEDIRVVDAPCAAAIAATAILEEDEVKPMDELTEEHGDGNADLTLQADATLAKDSSQALDGTNSAPDVHVSGSDEICKADSNTGFEELLTEGKDISEGHVHEADQSAIAGSKALPQLQSLVDEAAQERHSPDTLEDTVDAASKTESADPDPTDDCRESARNSATFSEEPTATAPVRQISWGPDSEEEGSAEEEVVQKRWSMADCAHHASFEAKFHESEQGMRAPEATVELRDKRRCRHAALFIQRTWRLVKRKNGDSLDSQSPGDCTPKASAILHEAVEAKNEELALMLIRQGNCRLLNHVDVLGRTALHLAARQDMTEVCKALLEHRYFASANALHWGGWTALHLAARQGHAGPSKALLASPKFHVVNAEDGDGRTALHNAGVSGNLEVISAILEHPQFTMVDSYNAGGFSALHVAERHGHADACKLIAQYSEDGPNNLTRAKSTEASRRSSLTSRRSSTRSHPKAPSQRPRISVLGAAASTSSPIVSQATIPILEEEEG